MNTYIKYQIIFLVFFLTFISCKKIIEVGPPKTQLTPEKAFSDDLSAVAVISNIYAQFNSLIDGNLTPPLGTYCDELSTTSPDAQDLEYYNGNVSVINSRNLNLWESLYSVIYQSNALIENIKSSANVTTSTKQQLNGEALFLRSLAYFYLINIYGDVPLLLTTQVGVTSTAPRDSISHIYDQIITDLVQAKSILSESYPSAEKVRANKWAASALLARVYLYQKDWQSAISESSKIIESGIYSPLDNLSDVFEKNSRESILQFWTQEGYTIEGPLFIPGAGSIATYPITQNLLNAFESGDQRKSYWIDSLVDGTQIYYYPSKYKNRGPATGNTGEYLSILRLSEQYLIRAEAFAEENNISEAQADLNIIRNRAGLINTTANDKTSLLIAIQHERQVELFCEWGHRFSDLKRNDQLNQVMSLLKPSWSERSDLLPIPQYERLNNQNLTQNPGY